MKVVEKNPSKGVNTYKATGVIEDGFKCQFTQGEQTAVLDMPEVTTQGEWSADVHGTAVAGIIAAAENNNEGSYGVAPEVEILAYKACEAVAPGKQESRCWTSSIVKALDLSITNNANVINMSLTGPPDDLVESEAGGDGEPTHIVRP